MSENGVLGTLLARLETLENIVKSQQNTISQLQNPATTSPNNSSQYDTTLVSNQKTGGTSASKGKLSRKRLLKGLAVAATVIGTTSVLNQNTAQAATVSNTDAVLAFDGTATGTSGVGVQGTASAATGGTFGVRGISDSTTGRGVGGFATATSGDTYGVIGSSDSTTGRGVYGLAASTTGNSSGVYGQSTSNSGRGVTGITTNSTGSNYGVFGQANSSAGRGVGGFATATSGDTYGVIGSSESTSGRGVYGLVANITGTTFGVYGQSISPDGRGVYGKGGKYGAEFESTNVPLHLIAGATAGAPIAGNHVKGELYVASDGALFYCTADGTPGTWVRLSNGLVAGGNVTLTPNADGTTTLAATGGVASVNGQTGAVNLAFSNVVFLTNPIRVVASTNSGGTAALLTSDGSGTPNASFQAFQISGVIVNGLSVPAGAKGIIGSLTSVGASTAGNLRLWATGATPPTVNTLNVPLNSASGKGFNLTTAFTVALSNDGKVSIGYSNGTAGSNCGFSIDVVAYIL
jgi:hypothetical protein